MGGTLPVCPFCKKLLRCVKDHVKAKHPERYRQWIDDGRLPYWMYDDAGELRPAYHDIAAANQPRRSR